MTWTQTWQENQKPVKIPPSSPVPNPKESCNDRIGLPLPRTLARKIPLPFFNIGLERDILFGILSLGSIQSHEFLEE